MSERSSTDTLSTDAEHEAASRSHLDGAAILAILNTERFFANKDELPPESMDVGNPAHAEYERAVADLKASQDHYLAEHKDLAEQNALLTGRPFSPAAARAIEALGVEVGADEMMYAVQSLEHWNMVAESRLTDGRIKFVEALPVLQRAWGEERVNKQLDSVAQYDPVALVEVYPQLQDKLGPEKADELMRAATASFLDAQNMLANSFDKVIRNDQFRAAVGEEATKAVAQTLMREPESYFVDHNPFSNTEKEKPLVDFFESEQLVSQTDIAQGYLEILQRDSYLSADFLEHVNEYRDLLSQEGLLGDAKVAIRRLFSSGDMPLYALNGATLLTDDEKREIARSVLITNPEKLLSYGAEDVARQYLEEPEYDELLQDAIVHAEPRDVVYYAVSAVDELSSSERSDLIRTALDREPGLVLDSFEAVKGYLTTQECSLRVQNAFESASDDELGRYYFRVEKWLPYLTDETLQQRQVLEACMRTAGSMGYLDVYDNSSLWQSLVSKQELEQITRDILMELEPHAYFGGGENLARRFGPDTVREWVQHAAAVNPCAAASLLRANYKIFSPGEITAIARTAVANDAEALADLSPLSNVVPETEVVEAVRSKISTDSIGAAFLIESLRSIEGQTAAYDTLAADLRRANPAVMYMYAPTNAKRHELIEYMRTQHTVGDVAPAWFKEFMQAYEKSSESNRPLVIAEAVRIYEQYTLMSERAPELLEKVQTMGVSAKSQQEVICQFAFLAANGADLANLGSKEDLDKRVFDSLELLIGNEVSPQARKACAPAMMPLLTYILQHGTSEAHMDLLGQLVSSHADDDTYRNFRLIANDENALADAQKNGLLPVGLTRHQHHVWREDDTVYSEESLKVSAEDVASKIRQIVTSKSEVLLSASANPGETSADVEVIDERKLRHEVGILGKELAQLHRERSLPTTDPSLLERQIQRVEKKLANSQLQLGLHQLARLSADNIIRGTVTTVDTGKKVQNIDSLLQRLHKIVAKQQLPQEATMMLGNIGQVIEEFSRTADTVQELVASDTIDMKTMLEIGAKPVGSCQHYATGTYNECLLGYTEPNTKLMVLRNGEKIVARSVLRLLEQPDGSPMLFMEMIYTQNASQSVTTRMFELASVKAEKMGVPVFAPANIGFTPEGKSAFMLTKTAIRGSAGTLRAPFVYGDSFGGKTSRGYRVSKMKQLERQK